MTTYNTGNPIGSTDARDRLDNTENFDKSLNDTSLTWVDRLGVTRDSFEGRLAKGSFYRVGDFTTGYTLTNMRQTLEYNGHEYSWAGTFPKVVSSGSTPTPLAEGAWIDRSGDILRKELYATTRNQLSKSIREAGYSMVSGSFEEGGTVSNIDDTLWSQTNGKAYSWGGVLPKVVSYGSTPDGTGGVGPGAWVDRAGVVLRDQLAESTGATKVGTSDGRTVEQRLAALPNEVETALAASAYIKDASRHAVERASGGRQTVLYDDLGNPSIMNIVPIFRYEDLGYNADMGSGVVSCFDVGTGTNKSEIFIGAFQSSLVGSRAVSLPRTDPTTSINFDTAKTYCANKGAGWHLMTMHEWAAISLWCMANGFEPRGNTNNGRAHDRYVEQGRRMDGGLPGDSAGTPRVYAGSGPDAWRHNNSPWGISDLVGNVWEWIDGFKLQDGRIIASTFNTQAEANWVAQAAYFDSTLTTGGAPRLSNAVVNRLGTIGDNANVGNTASEAFNVMTKEGTYVSNQLLKRLLVEPATVLPKGRVYMRNFGERLPLRGGTWSIDSSSGLAALNCNTSRVYTYSSFGFRLAFSN